MNAQNKTIVLNDIDIKKRIAVEVAKQQSYLIGYFTKTSVPNLVVTQWAAISFSNPVFLQFIAESYAKIIETLGEYDLICGIETAGIGLAAATSVKTNIPWIYSRKERKTSGGREAFEGTYHKGDNVLFVDNFSATGKGMLSVMVHAQEEEFTFGDLLVVVDNEWKKNEVFNQAITTYALITNRELTHYLNELGYFPGKLYDYCIMYLDEPERLKPGLPDTEKFIEELRNAPDLPYIKKNTLPTYE